MTQTAKQMYRYHLNKSGETFIVWDDVKKRELYRTADAHNAHVYISGLVQS